MGGVGRLERLKKELEEAETEGDNARRAKMGAMRRQLVIAEVRVRTLTLRADIAQIGIDTFKADTTNAESMRAELRSERAQLLTHLPKAELSVRAASKQLGDDLLQELKDRLDQQDTLTSRATALHH